MYASKRSVAKAQGLKTDSKSTRNRLMHRGMQKDYVQVTPDGKHIQHYKMDTRSAQFMKALKKAQKEAVEKENVEEAVETPETKDEVE